MSRRIRRRRVSATYQPNDVLALDHLQLYFNVLDGHCHAATILDLMSMAEGTAYDQDLHDYVRFELFERDLAFYHPGHYKYYTMDGQCHHFDIRSREDASRFFHELIMDKDQLVFPNAEDYLGCSFCTAAVPLDEFNLVA